MSENNHEEKNSNINTCIPQKYIRKKYIIL